MPRGPGHCGEGGQAAAAEEEDTFWAARTHAARRERHSRERALGRTRRRQSSTRAHRPCHGLGWRRAHHASLTSGPSRADGIRARKPRAAHPTGGRPRPESARALPIPPSTVPFNEIIDEVSKRGFTFSTSLVFSRVRASEGAHQQWLWHRSDRAQRTRSGKPNLRPGWEPQRACVKGSARTRVSLFSGFCLSFVFFVVVVVFAF